MAGFIHGACESHINVAGFYVKSVKNSDCYLLMMDLSNVPWLKWFHNLNMFYSPLKRVRIVTLMGACWTPNSLNLNGLRTGGLSSDGISAHSL